MTDNTISCGDPHPQLYVAYFIPNGMFSTVHRHVSDLKTPDPRMLGELPPNVFAVQFFERLHATAFLPSGETQILMGPEFNQTPRYFMRGKLYRVDEVDDTSVAYTNLVNFKINKAVKFQGNWFPYEHGEDIFVPKYGHLLDEPTTTENE